MAKKLVRENDFRTIRYAAAVGSTWSVEIHQKGTWSFVGKEDTRDGARSKIRSLKRLMAEGVPESQIVGLPAHRETQDGR